MASIFLLMTMENLQCVYWKVCLRSFFFEINDSLIKFL
jgi:hypothetical protein